MMPPETRCITLLRRWSTRRGWYKARCQCHAAPGETYCPNHGGRSRDAALRRLERLAAVPPPWTWLQRVRAYHDITDLRRQDACADAHYAILDAAPHTDP